MNPAPSPASKLDRRIWRLLGVTCLAALGLALAGSWFISTLEGESVREHYAVLSAIAQMKTDQLLSWRFSRLADARMNSTGLVKAITQEWLRTGNRHELDRIAARLRIFRENEGYHNLILADTGGQVWVSLVGTNKKLEHGEQSLLETVLATQQPTMGDFYYCHICKQIHIVVGAPVVDKDNKTIAVLLLIADPARDIFPLLQTWPLSQDNTMPPRANESFLGFLDPTPNAEAQSWPGANEYANGESVLVRREGNSVLYLSPQFRPRAVPAFEFRLQLSQAEFPAVRACLGESGMVRGTDYSGDVLADIRAVPATGWYMVTKMDLHGVLAKARFQGGGLLLLFALTIGLTVVLARLATVSRQRNLSESLLQAELERGRTRKELRATLYGIGDGVISADAAGRVTRMNPAAEILTGWQENEALGQPVATIFQKVDEETEEIIELPVNRVLAEGKFIEVSNPAFLIARNGERRPITDSWSPIHNESGEVTGVVLVARDQAKRRAMEKAQAESAKRYSDLVDSIQDLLWETGPDYCLTFVSQRANDILGYGPEEIIGKVWDIFLSPGEACSPKDFLTRIPSTPKPYNQCCQTFLRKDGSMVTLESSATPIFDKQDRFLGYRGISRDVTERHLAEEEQGKLQAQLLQAQKMDTVGRLAGGVAHDFNNMLTVICSYVEMTLNELEATHPLYKRMYEVHQAAQHSADLTRQLLAFARKQVISPQVLDLNETISGALKMLHRLIGENIKLIWNPGPNLWYVRMDSTQIGQILANLAVNARDAINGPGKLIIETSNIVLNEADCAINLDLAPGNFVLMTVNDEGCGMDQETLSRIFEPFFTTKEEGKGTGLGLAMVYGIVKQNNGAVAVSSEPGQGTTFKIYLPQVHLGNKVTLTSNSNIADIGTETILLVEDETAILELGAYILEQRGYTVLTALSPSKALALVLEYRGTIDLLITDVIMPEMNGRDLAKEILVIRPDMKVLFISGYTADVISHYGGLEPGIHFLEKPFLASSLGRKVRDVLDPAIGQNQASG